MWSDGEDDDQGVEEWVEGEAETAQREAALASAFASLGVDEAVAASWFRGRGAGLDVYGGVRVVNSLRRARARGDTVDSAAFDTAVDAAKAQGSCEDGADDGLLPVVPDDPLIGWLLDLDLEEEEEDGDDDDNDDERGGGKVDHEEDEGSGEGWRRKALRETWAAPGGEESGERPGFGLAPVVVSEDLVPCLPTEAEVAAARAMHSGGGPEDDDAVSSASESASGSSSSSEAGAYGEGNKRHEESYFASYDGWGIHREMVGDVVRTTAYADAIERNGAYFRGKTVLDVGCGTGILSMLAARAGAARVVGVDMAEIVSVARANVERNGLSGVVEIHRGKLEVIAEGVLRGLKVDVIVSEWMGYALLFESMLDSVLFARDRFLVPGGRVLPDRCTMHICGVSDPRRLVRFWDDVHGFDMRPVGDMVRRSVTPHAVVDTVDQASDVLTGVAHLRDVPCETVSLQDLEFSEAFSVDVSKGGSLDAVAIYFDTFFGGAGLGTPVSFSTGPVRPDRPATHWQQTLLFLDPPPDVQPGDVLRGRFSLARNRSAPRCLDLSLEYSVLDASGSPKQAFATGDRIHSYDMWDEPVEHKPRT